VEVDRVEYVGDAACGRDWFGLVGVIVLGGIKWFGEGGRIVKPEATGLLTENEDVFMVSLL
jgi:hypothetical protein